jgi:ribosomal small subunit protein bTHX
MGRGDKKSAKGKRTIGSFGVSRSRKATKAKLTRTASKKPVEAAAAPVAKAKKVAAPRKKAE